MTTRDLLLDAAGDLDLTTGDAQLVSDLVAIAQELRIRLRTFVGEYFLDTGRGLPWLSWSEGKMPEATLRQIEALARAEILKVPGVVRVEASKVAAVFDRATQAATLTVTEVLTDLGVLQTLSVTIEATP